MHHVTLERWSRESSLLHARDPRAKILLLAAFLVALATTGSLTPKSAIPYAGLLAAGIALSRLPVGGLLLRAAVVLPFTAVFAAASFFAGDGARAAALLFRTYFSALAVLLVAGSTPLPRLLRGLESLGTPSFLILVVQFLYRYLFVVSEQAQHMRLAAACRSGGTRARRSGFRAAAGVVAVLFARSYGRAEGIHNAMLSRCFDGRMHPLNPPRARPADLSFLTAGIALVAVCRFAAGALR